MKTSEKLAACIPLIENKNHLFICHALCHIEHGKDWIEHWKDWEQSPNPLKIFIHERLAGHATLGEFCLELRFVIENIIQIPHQDWFDDSDEVRQFRVEWLKSLVEEFQVKGD